MKLTSYPPALFHLYPSHKNELNLNISPLDTAIAPYNLDNLQNPGQNQIPYLLHQGAETLSYTLKPTFHHYWKLNLKVALPNLPNNHALAIPHENITHLPSESRSPETNIKKGSHYVIEKILPELKKPLLSPTRAEQNPSQIFGLRPILPKLSLKRRLEETEEEMPTNKRIKNTSVEGNKGGLLSTNIKGRKKKSPRN